MGVHYDRAHDAWRAQIRVRVEGHTYHKHLGYFLYEKDARNRYDDFVQIVEEWRRDGMKIPFRELVHETLEEFHARVKELGDAHFYETIVDPEKRCELPRKNNG